MIPLKYRCNDDILNQYYELVIRHKSRSYLEDIDKKCKKHFRVTFEYVVKSSPEQLKSLIATLNANNDFNTIKADFKDIKSRNSQKPNDYIVNVLYNNLPQEAKWLLFRSVGQKVCPYCNRNYIEEIRNNGEEHSRKITGTFELDHFYPKDEYPMFAVSFYNLIPVCGICNSIKNNQIFAQHPYDWNPDDVEFTYNIVGTEYLDNENDIEIQIRGNDNVKKQIEILHMTELYNGHKDVAQEIIKKVKYYNKSYIDCLFNQLGELFENKEEIYRLLYGGYANPDEFGRRPLSKFIKDIYHDTVKAVNGTDLLEYLNEED